MKNRRTLDNVIQHFFSCDRQTILEIMDELISAMQAEEFLPPGRLMSRNYDTAQDNPEIHSRPGNLKDARDAIFPYLMNRTKRSSATSSSAELPSLRRLARSMPCRSLQWR